MPASEGKDIYRVVRVIEYIGPKEWIERTLEQSMLTRQQDLSIFGSDRRIQAIVTSPIKRVTEVKVEVINHAS